MWSLNFKHNKLLFFFYWWTANCMLNKKPAVSEFVDAVLVKG